MLFPFLVLLVLQPSCYGLFNIAEGETFSVGLTSSTSFLQQNFLLNNQISFTWNSSEPIQSAGRHYYTNTSLLLTFFKTELADRTRVITIRYFDIFWNEM